MNTGAAPFSMHLLAQSGLVAVKMPEAARARAHCESENEPVQVMVWGAAVELFVNVNAVIQIENKFAKVRTVVRSSPI
jgi:hypothetical protein